MRKTMTRRCCATSSRGPVTSGNWPAGLVGGELAWTTDIDPASVDMSDVRVAAWVWLTRTWPEGGPWEGRGRAGRAALPAG